jgi:hypothetical protein
MEPASAGGGALPGSLREELAATALEVVGTPEAVDPVVEPPHAVRDTMNNPATGQHSLVITVTPHEHNVCRGWRVTCVDVADF